ncbi:HEAT repeat domain-containing protein [Halobacteriaceae archaeon GCM10025711]
MRDEEEATDGPPDPGLDPERSPGFGEEPAGLEDIEVSRDDVTIGEATPEELTSSDTDPVAGEEVETLLAHLADGSSIERRRAALALAERSATPTVVQALVTAGRTDDDADVRQFAAEALGKLGGDEAAAGVLAITRDEDPWVRSEAIVALDRLDRAAHEDRLVEALDDDHHAVRRNAAISLFKHRGEDALDLLLDQVDDPSERVREWAAHLLGGVADERAEDALRDLAENDPVELVRTTAARSLQTDAGSFRRQFTGALDDSPSLPGEDTLNRRPDL